MAPVGDTGLRPPSIHLAQTASHTSNYNATYILFYSLSFILSLFLIQLLAPTSNKDVFMFYVMFM